MDIKQDVRDIETRLKIAEISVADFCDSAEVNRATWQKWKNGEAMPQMRKWMRVMERCETLPSPEETA